MTEQNQSEQLEDTHDEDVDQSPGDPVYDAPDPEQAAEPVENQSERVQGRRNEDLPTENLTVPPTN